MPNRRVLRRVRVDTWNGCLRHEAWEREGYLMCVEDPFDRWVASAAHTVASAGTQCALSTYGGVSPCILGLWLPFEELLNPCPWPSSSLFPPPSLLRSTDNCARTVRSPENAARIAAAFSVSADAMRELTEPEDVSHRLEWLFGADVAARAGAWGVLHAANPPAVKVGAVAGWELRVPLTRLAGAGAALERRFSKSLPQQN